MLDESATTREDPSRLPVARGRRAISVEREIEDLARRVAREEIARSLAAPNDSPWLTVEQTAELLRTSPGAIRQRISTGWLAGDTVRDGKRRFIRREAVLRELDRLAQG